MEPRAWGAEHHRPFVRIAKVHANRILRARAPFRREMGTICRHVGSEPHGDCDEDIRRLGEESQGGLIYDLGRGRASHLGHDTALAHQ